MFFREKTKGNMVDMHCHVLPAVDDGSQSIEQTMDMLQTAMEEGIRAMIVTPHFKEGRRNVSVQTILERIQLVQDAAREYGYLISLYPGNEIFYFTGMEEKLEKGEILSLNYTDRVLIEFSPAESYTYIRNALDNVRTSGYVPILAHVERYECMVRHPEYVNELKQFDVEIQINAASAEGQLGRRIQQFIFEILKNELVDYVATDAHDRKNRAPRFQKCYQLLRKKLKATYIDEIFYENALAIIQAE